MAKSGDRIDLELIDNKLKFNLTNPSYQGLDANGTYVQIDNLLTKGTTINIDIKTPKGVLNDDVRDILRSQTFKDIFPEVELSKDKQNVEGWNTDKARQVSYFGSGVGGTIIGFGCTLLAITDDLFRSYEDAVSETINEKTFSWWQGTHSSRLEKNVPSIDLGTRWSKKDVLGRLEEMDFYNKVIKFLEF